MRRILRYILILFLLTTVAAHSAEFKLLNRPGLINDEWAAGEILIQGEIRSGDSDRFSSFLNQAQFPEISYGGVGDEYTVVLNSHGGDLYEGLLIGREIFGRGFSTVIKGRHKCLSACAWAFLSGRYLGAQGSWRPARTIKKNGILAFHGYYSEENRTTLENEVAETFLTLNALLTESLARWKIPDLAFIAELMKVSPTQQIIINKPSQLSKLAIDYNPPKEEILQLINGTYACGKIVLKVDNGEWGLQERLGYEDGDVIPQPPKFNLKNLQQYVSNTNKEKYNQLLESVMETSIRNKYEPLIDRLFDGLSYRLQSADYAVHMSTGRGGGFYYDNCIALLNFSSFSGSVFLWDRVTVTMDKHFVRWLDFVQPNKELWSAKIQDDGLNIKW